jgi:hypothetical protein
VNNGGYFFVLDALLTELVLRRWSRVAVPSLRCPFPFVGQRGDPFGAARGGPLGGDWRVRFPIFGSAPPFRGAGSLKGPACYLVIWKLFLQ